MRATRFGFLGVPSSAAAHWPGQENAPEALRRAGLADRLPVRDYGDLPRIRMRPDRGHPQNFALTAEVAAAVAGRVEGIVRDGLVPLVVGGDCTIELGVVAGALRAGADPALVYVDGGADLRTPETAPTGVLDSMGAAHLLDLPGAAPELAGLGPRRPLLAPGALVFFGYERSDNARERDAFDRLDSRRLPAAAVRARDSPG
ncbi:arginase family protein [Nonomuraea sp. NPDC050783]|uniref:arginase family protein n=1 Tax=Nonomuraea sp. NPDC050783 TaxID=3154634 RepID=UPI003467BB0F